MINKQNKLIIFQDKQIRRVWHGDEWWFSVADVVETLTNTVDVRDYIKKTRKRDKELNSYWGTNCPRVEMLIENYG